jgi:hypothetical protein
MTEEEHREKNLQQRWYRSKKKQVLDEYIGVPIEYVPEEYAEMIQRLRSWGLGEKTEVISVYEQIIEWLETHDGKMPRGNICKNRKNINLC